MLFKRKREFDCLFEGILRYDIGIEVYYVHTHDNRKIEIFEGDELLIFTSTGWVKTAYKEGKFEGMDDINVIAFQVKVLK